MKTLSDEEILNELKRRFAQDKLAMESQKNTMQQLQALNSRLQDAEKSKSSFLSNIRNEIINPFTGILELSASIMTMKAEDISRIQTWPGS